MKDLACSENDSTPLTGTRSVWSCDADSWTCTTACSAELLHTTSLSAQASPAGGAQVYTMCCDRDCCWKIRELLACLQSHKVGTSCSRVNIRNVRNCLRLPEGLWQSPGGAHLLYARHGALDSQSAVTAEPRTGSLAVHHHL